MCLVDFATSEHEWLQSHSWVWGVADALREAFPNLALKHFIVDGADIDRIRGGVVSGHCPWEVVRCEGSFGDMFAQSSDVGDSWIFRQCPPGPVGG